jgi:hypothetical protein
MKRCREVLSTPSVLRRSCEFHFAIRAARVLTFGGRDTVEFTMGIDEWKAWEMALLRHAAIIDHDGHSVTSALEKVAFDVCQAEHTYVGPFSRQR